MSTFHGHVSEFPDIRIDNFRTIHDRPPLAVFLSHVHTDHTVGLESFKSCFVYCAPATKEILLKLEKYPHRMNFAKGILEARLQHFRHLRKLLKPIPLETPTDIELEPGNTIRVTLFDANHCIGAVMFLIEGDGKAILYTGDIRSEAWWVDSLKRNPLLVPYVAGSGTQPIKRLDRLYLDTTFVSGGLVKQHRSFPSKADGLAELIRKVSAYPIETVFYFDAWTFGYEEVWQALASFLGVAVHLDEYRYNLYASLAKGSQPHAIDVTKMLGYFLGNHWKPGFISSRPTRLHSCEEGVGCDVFKGGYVRITPIISRFEGNDLMEAGAGGGKGDLDQRHELETGDLGLVFELLEYCRVKLQDSPDLLKEVVELVTRAIQAKEQAISLDTSVFKEAWQASSQEGEDALHVADLPIERLISALTRLVDGKKHLGGTAATPMPASTRSDGLPDRITFPYSRHSSYAELCLLVEAFKPADIYPCTVFEDSWHVSLSMHALFGHIYEDCQAVVEFYHDRLMIQQRGASDNEEDDTPHSTPERASSRVSSPRIDHKRKHDDTRGGSAGYPPQNMSRQTRPEQLIGEGFLQRGSPTESRGSPGPNVRSGANEPETERPSQKRRHTSRQLRKEAYDKALKGEWFGMHLASTSDYQLEDEL